MISMIARRIPIRAAARLLTLVTSIGIVAQGHAQQRELPGVVLEEFIYESAPFPECHASTICQTPEGLVAAWFGGTREGHSDVGIWVARKSDGAWSAPQEAANGVQDDGQRHPCWNPVLFQPPDGPLLLFFKVGPSPSTWWGMVTTSGDHGKTWSDPRRLPDRILGPIKNKPILLDNGRLLCGSSSEDQGWRVFMETATTTADDWKQIGPLNDAEQFGAIQPTILVHGGGRLQILCRSRQGVLTTCWSEDHGETWSPMQRTELPNPNAGADAVTLRDGTHLLVYNHSVRQGPFPSGRQVLNVATSRDGTTWHAALVLEQQPGEYSYPAVIQTDDGLVHITYTYRREKVKHIVLDPTKLMTKPIVDGKWPE